jgi:serine/threonine protein phosphatase PrpC
MLTDEEIRDLTVSSENLETAARRLIERANEHGGEDNCTVVLVAIEA